MTRLLQGLALFIIGAIVLLFMQAAGVAAVGPPSDNTTGQDFPSDNRTMNEIKPVVEYILQGPSVQSDKAAPHIIAALAGISGKPVSNFTSGDTWYLDLDINLPGWVSIYEYYPQGSGSPGRWITYTWQLDKSGRWRFGPFTPITGEPEGQHIYGIWFYSDGKWANDTAPQKNTLVYWTYAGTAAPATTPTTPPVKEASFIDRIFGWITQPVVLLFIPFILTIAILVSIIIYRRRGVAETDEDILLLPGGIAENPPTPELEKETEKVEVPANAARVKLSLPNGSDIRFKGNKVIGRSELARALEIDRLGLISRRHFEVKFKEDKYFVEDLGSANGTRLNGDDISGKGPVALSDNDVIEPAAAIKLKFCLLS